MDLLLIVLVAIAMLLLALRGRQKRRRPAPRRAPGPASARPARRRSFSRYPREDWRYWRDLAIVIALVLLLLIATAFIGTRYA
ncbi:hypothetical protein LV475_00980 [Guyparkeria hydrothermalis]|uniref:Uncharacterized protein n=1 Tax=Guyparkeria halophila TaxID=47960 RepID=A0A6I6D3Q3_9GAMM|nr:MULTISPECIES: hypothetical protein [Guyparkeria]MCL7750184.1 hypothetical protein [Guyparkeria hydrothermalis]QGT78775.1 hypothetical protein GM160_07600 [Guyparkeria halophila]